MKMLPAGRDGDKRVVFWALLILCCKKESVQNLSSLLSGSWGEKWSCDEVVQELWGNLGGACMTLDQLLRLSALLFLDDERI